MTCFIIFDSIIISAMKFAHTGYIQSKDILNQVVYYFGNLIYRRSRVFFGLKLFLVSTLNTVNEILWDDIMSEQPQIRQSLSI